MTVGDTRAVQVIAKKATKHHDDNKLNK